MGATRLRQKKTWTGKEEGRLLGAGNSHAKSVQNCLTPTQDFEMIMGVGRGDVHSALYGACGSVDLYFELHSIAIETI